MSTWNVNNNRIPRTAHVPILPAPDMVSAVTASAITSGTGSSLHVVSLLKWNARMTGRSRALSGPGNNLERVWKIEK